MRHSVATAVLVSHREELAEVRPRSANSGHGAQVSASPLRELAGEAIRRTHGKALAAADVVGVSESQLGRLVNDGDLKLKHLEVLGPKTLAALGRELVNAYGTLDTPQSRLRQIIRQRRELDREEEQIIEGLIA